MVDVGASLLPAAASRGAVAAEELDELDRTGLDAPRRRVQPRSADLAASEGRAEVLDRPPSSGGMSGLLRHASSASKRRSRPTSSRSGQRR